MSLANFEPFDIRNYFDKLTLVKGSRTKYYCPYCGKNDFSVDKKTGKYNCFSGRCDPKDIREAIAPWEEKIKGNRRSVEVTTQTKSQSQKNVQAAKTDSNQSNQSASQPIPPTDQTNQPNQSASQPIPPTDPQPAQPYLPTFPKAEDVQPLPNHLGKKRFSELAPQLGRVENFIKTEKTNKGIEYFYDSLHKTIRQEWIDKEGRNQKAIYPYCDFPEGYTDNEDKYHEPGWYYKKNGDYPLFNLDQIDDSHKDSYILWVEGEKCCVIASHSGLLAITAQGGSWGIKELKSEIKKLVGKVAGLLIIPDNDNQGAKKASDVHEVCNSVGLLSVPLSRECLYSNLPEKSDIEQIAQSLDGKRVYEHFQSLLTQNFNTGSVQTAKAVNTGSVQTEEIPEEPNDSPLPEAKKDKVTARELADHLAQTFKDKFCFNENNSLWYQWVGTHWEPINDNCFHRHLKLTCDGLFHITSAGWYDQIRTYIKADLHHESKTDLTSGAYLNFKNGCLNLTTMEIIPTIPNDWILTCLPRDYSVMELKPNLLAQLARDCPNFWSWANQAMGNDPQKVLLLLVCINGVLTQKFSEYQRFLWLYGLPAAGKGTFTRLLSDLVGKQNTYSTDLGKLSEDRDKAALADKTITFLPDQDRQVSGFGSLKSLVGQDLISARLLYKECFTFVYTGTVVLTSNTPVLKGDTTGLDRRTLLIQFKNPVDVENRDKKLSEKLSSELDRLTPIALGLPEKLVEDFILSTGEGHIVEFEAAKWETQCDSDSISAWIDERIIFDLTCSEPVGNVDSSTGHLFANYLEYCTQAKFTPKSRNNFSRDLIVVAQALGHKAEKIKNNVMTIKGLRLKTKSEQEEHQSPVSPVSIQGKALESPVSLPQVSRESPVSFDVHSHANNFTGDLNEQTGDLNEQTGDLNEQTGDLKPIQDKQTGDTGDTGDLEQQNIFTPENSTLSNENNQDSLNLATLLITHWNDGTELCKVFAQYSDSDIESEYLTVHQELAKEDKEIADKALDEISYARFTYKFVNCSGDCAKGKLFVYLTDLYSHYQNIARTLPKSLTFETLDFSDWEWHLEEAAKSAGLLNTYPGRTILTKDFPKPLPVGTLLTGWQPIIDERIEFEIKEIKDYGRAGTVYSDGNSTELDHKFVVKVILPKTTE